MSDQWDSETPILGQFEPEHYRILTDEGVYAWNAWREKNPSVVPLLAHAKLSEMDLREVNLKDAVLVGADFGVSDLQRASFMQANAHQARLVGAKLGDAHLDWADFSESFLDASKLPDAQMFRINLRGASLSGANLAGATLIGADLRNTNLLEARLLRASLSGADLSGAFLGLATRALEWADLYAECKWDRVRIDYPENRGIEKKTLVRIGQETIAEALGREVREMLGPSHIVVVFEMPSRIELLMIEAGIVEALGEDAEFSIEKSDSGDRMALSFGSTEALQTGFAALAIQLAALNYAAPGLVKSVRAEHPDQESVTIISGEDLGKARAEAERMRSGDWVVECLAGIFPGWVSPAVEALLKTERAQGLLSAAKDRLGAWTRRKQLASSEDRQLLLPPQPPQDTTPHQ